MLQHGDGLRWGEHSAADVTGCGAGGCLAGKSGALMAQGGNRLRRGDDLTADAAFCTGGASNLFTAGLHSRDFL